MKKWGVVSVALALAACAAQVKTGWLRVDGQPIAASPQLQQQFVLDQTACQGEMQKANLSGTSFCNGMIDCVATGVARNQSMAAVGKGCMADRGYVQVPVDDAGHPIAAPAPAAAVAASPAVQPSQ